jgi:hypothetical protein
LIFKQRFPFLYHHASRLGNFEWRHLQLKDCAACRDCFTCLGIRATVLGQDYLCATVGTWVLVVLPHTSLGGEEGMQTFPANLIDFGIVLRRIPGMAQEDGEGLKTAMQ